MSPERGRPEGVTELGFKGKTDEGTCETFPRVFPFYGDSTVSGIKNYNAKMKLKLKFIENNPGLIDSPSEKILGPRPY